MMEDFLKAGEVSKILNASEEFVYKHAKELGGIKIGKKMVRFSKRKFQEIMGVINNGDLQTQGEVDVRLLEERSEVQEGGLPGQARSDRGRSQDKKHSQADKYGLREIMRRTVG